MYKRVPLIAVTIFPLLLAGCDSQPGSGHLPVAAPLPVVNTTKVEILPSYRVERQFVGTVRAVQSANLGFELGGKVNTISVDVGDKVRPGQSLITLDTQLLDTEAQQLNAQREQLDAQLELVKSNLARQRQLKNKGFSADADIDSLISQRDALLANMRQLDASLSSNALKKQKSTIYAPYAGTINERVVSAGDVVNVGSPTLTLLADGQKEVHAGVPVKLLSALTQDEQANIRIGNTTYPAQLLTSGAAVDPRSRTVTLRYLLPDDVSLLDGEMAYLLFQVTQEQQGFWVPLTALTDGLRGTWNVYVIVPDSEGGQFISRRSVQVHHADDDKAYVSGPIAHGDQVVMDGVHRIVSGQHVSLAAE